MKDFIRTMCKFFALGAASLIIWVDFLYRRFLTKPVDKSAVSGIQEKKTTINKKVAYFDRDVIDGTADAGAKTIFETMRFLRESDILTRYVLVTLQKTNLPDTLQPFFYEKSSFELSNILRCRRVLGDSDYVLVKTPENMVVLCVLLAFSSRRPTVWYYGGDIYSLRYKTALSNQDGLNFFLCLLKYVLYSFFEFLIWPIADACLSPNTAEANLIRGYNRNSMVLPIRIFRDLSSEPGNHKVYEREQNNIHFIFVGGAGHSPNILALKHAVTVVLPELVQKCSPNLVFNIVGDGWDSDKFSEWLNFSENCIFHGRVSDRELDLIYERCHFALAMVQDGAGVKGKVIEAMYKNKIVITTAIGAQGIPSDVLPFFNSVTEISAYVNKMIRDEEARFRTLQGYLSFLEEYYSTKTIAELFKTLIPRS